MKNQSEKFKYIAGRSYPTNFKRFYRKRITTQKLQQSQITPVPIFIECSIGLQCPQSIMKIYNSRENTLFYLLSLRLK